MKTLRQLYNHKIKYPGSSSFYVITIKVGGNAKSKADLEKRLYGIYPGLEKYLHDREFMLEVKK